MQFIDTHIHLQDYKINSAQIVQNLRDLGFVKAVCVSVREQDFAVVAKLSESAKDLIIPAFGVHPWHLENLSDNWFEILQKYLRQYPQAHIGECGLDRLHGGAMDKQMQVLREHLRLAKELNRPLNLHILKAEDVLLSLKNELPEMMVLHSFSGSSKFLQEMLKTKAFFSLNPKLRQRRNFVELVQQIPQDRMLVESDAPYQADFKDIPVLLAQIAQILKLPIENLADRLCDNFVQLCG